MLGLAHNRNSNLSSLRRTEKSAVAIPNTRRHSLLLFRVFCLLPDALLQLFQSTSFGITCLEGPRVFRRLGLFDGFGGKSLAVVVIGTSAVVDGKIIRGFQRAGIVPPSEAFKRHVGFLRRQIVERQLFLTVQVNPKRLVVRKIIHLRIQQLLRWMAEHRSQWHQFRFINIQFSSLERAFIGCCCIVLLLLLLVLPRTLFFSTVVPLSIVLVVAT